MKILLMFCLTLGFALTAFGQISTDGKAVIYIYAYDASAMGTVRKMVYMDDKELAQITPATYFIAVVEPGVHSLHFKEKKYGGIERDFKAGSITYLRAGWRESGMFIKPSGIDLVSPDNGVFDIKQLKPVDKKNIKDKDRAMLSL